MKKSFIITGLVCLLIITISIIYYFAFYLPNNRLFENKLKCTSYREDIEKALKKDEKPLTMTELMKIFYSPKRNSCVYYYTKRYFDPQSGDLSFWDYYLKDYLTGEIIESSSVNYGLKQDTQKELETVQAEIQNEAHLRNTMKELEGQ